MKVDSIYGRLIRTLSISITLVTIVILFVTDLFVDRWVHGEFDLAMYNKTNLLTTLISEDAHGVRFDFIGALMPEFESTNNAEYYQLWQAGKTIEKSSTLDFFAVHSLPYKELEIGKKILVEALLPDGRKGKILYYRFSPRLEQTSKKAVFNKPDTFKAPRESLVLAYAISAEKLNFLALMIDIGFLISAVLVAFIVRTIVKKVVSNGLAPLQELTQSLVNLSLADKTAEITSTHKIKELLPIQNSINTFIRENRALYLKEQRLASDMAHELKTPITELINLTEVSIKFPDDKSLSETYQSEVLEISSRLRSIVENMLLFHRYSNERFNKNDVFDVIQIINRLIDKPHRYSFNTDKLDPITSNLFAFESIITNLLKNAECYSPVDSTIYIDMESDSENGQINIKISNTCEKPLKTEDLKYLFDPLWQKDGARTSSNNYGLGLAIVQSFISALEGVISVSLKNDVIVFKLTILTH